MIEREERSSNKLHPLTDEFINRYNQYIKDKERVLKKSDDNPIAKKVKERTRRELENAKTSFKNIFEVRAKKIFQQAIIDLRMGASNDYEGMINKEKEYYNNIRKLLQEYFTNITRGNLKKQDNPTPIQDKNVLIRFTQEVPEFAWKEGTLGPFKKEDIANLPPEIAKLLISKGFAKEVIINV